MVNYTLSSGTSGDVGYLPNGQVEGAFNGNGGSTWWYEQYLWVGQRLMAYYDPDWNTYFIHRGGNGSSTQITNESGGLAGDMLFYPFGQEWAYDNGVNSAWWQFYNSFSRWNASLGFDLTPNRKYSPTLGRWMTPDPSGMAAASPANPQTWNMYAYVLNNPTSLIDTSGLIGCPGDRQSIDKKCNVYVSAHLPPPIPMSIVSLTNLELSNETNGPVTTAVGGAFGGGSSTTGNPGKQPTTTCIGTGKSTGNLNKGVTGALPGVKVGPGNVAIDPRVFGLRAGIGSTNKLLAKYSSQIKISFTPVPTLPSGFPTTFTVGDVVGPHFAMEENPPIFDINGLPNLPAAYAVTGIRQVTITFPASSPFKCGGGFKTE